MTYSFFGFLLLGWTGGEEERTIFIMERWISVLGVFTLLGIAYACSENRRAINWRTVGGALFIQVALAAWVLGSSSGQEVLGWLTTRVNVFSFMIIHKGSFVRFQAFRIHCFCQK